MDKRSKIYIAGHRGLVGSAMVKNLAIQTLGWEHTVELEEGVERVYERYLKV